MTRNEPPEARARHLIDGQLRAAGWDVQDRASLNLFAGPVALRETPTATGPADYILFVDRKACGVLEAKPAGRTLIGVGAQGADYAHAAPTNLPHWADPLPFLYLSTGTETLFQDFRDPASRPRGVFAPHRPETLRAMLATTPLRTRLRTPRPLDVTALRACQAEAIAGLEASLAAGKPRALVAMATGAGKTFTACALAHRLLSPPVRAGRVLFLVDRANLGDQAAREFRAFQPPGTGLTFGEEFVIQHLKTRTIDPAARVVVSTVQRLYAALRGEDIADEDDERGDFDRPADDVERVVAYSAAIPPETFDLVIIDECHRSIYGRWRQVLDYFDAFLVGLTATPGKHTVGIFQDNTVSEYPFERSVADGVNVGFDVWRIRTEVGEAGGTVPGRFRRPAPRSHHPPAPHCRPGGRSPVRSRRAQSPRGSPQPDPHRAGGLSRRARSPTLRAIAALKSSIATQS